MPFIGLFSDLGSDEEDSFADSFASCIEHDNLDSAMRRVSFSRSSGKNTFVKIHFSLYIFFYTPE